MSQLDDKRLYQLMQKRMDLGQTLAVLDSAVHASLSQIPYGQATMVLDALTQVKAKSGAIFDEAFALLQEAQDTHNTPNQPAVEATEPMDDYHPGVKDEMNDDDDDNNGDLFDVNADDVNNADKTEDDTDVIDADNAEDDDSDTDGDDEEDEDPDDGDDADEVFDDENGDAEDADDEALDDNEVDDEDENELAPDTDESESDIEAENDGVWDDNDQLASGYDNADELVDDDDQSETSNAQTALTDSHDRQAVSLHQDSLAVRDNLSQYSFLNDVTSVSNTALSSADSVVSSEPASVTESDVQHDADVTDSTNASSGAETSDNSGDESTEDNREKMNELLSQGQADDDENDLFSNLHLFSNSPKSSGGN